MVKATLLTRCGCWKHQDVTFPPPPTIMLLMKPSVSIFVTQDCARPSVEARTFELQRHEGGPNGYADYLER